MPNKKTVLLTVLLALMLAFLSIFGCGKAADQNIQNTELPEQKNYLFDYKVRAEASGGGNYIIETDDTVFFLLNGFVYFSDKENKDFLPLCPRPDCKHNDTDCSAYIDAVSFTVYGSYIYYVEGQSTKYDSVWRRHLCRMKLDGTAHESLLELPLPEVDFQFTSAAQGAVFTDKYAVVNTAVWDEYQEHKLGSNYVVDLDTLESTEISIPWLDFEYSGDFVPIEGIGDLLYCQVADNTSLLTDGTQVRYFCVLDCKTGVMNKIGILPEDIMTSEFDYYIDNDTLYFKCWMPGQTEMRLCRCGLDGSESVQIAEGSYGEINWNQFDWQNGMLFLDFRGDSETLEKGIYYTDLDLNTVDFRPYSAKELAEIKKIKCLFQTESYLFGIGPDKSGAYSAQNGVPEWYIDKADIGTGNLMWKRWAPEE